MLCNVYGNSKDSQYKLKYCLGLGQELLDQSGEFRLGDGAVVVGVDFSEGIVDVLFSDGLAGSFNSNVQDFL